jgi:hypothetical protein
MSCNTEQDIVYKGFPPPGEKDPPSAHRSKAGSWSAPSTSASWTHRWWSR